MIILSSYNKINQYTSIRTGETKLGEVISHLNQDILSENDMANILNTVTAKYIILGIPEDIGVRANLGKKGTRSGYDTFLRYFVNIQKNEFIDISKTYILGEINVEDLLDKSDKTEDIEIWRQLTSEVDNRVFPVISQIVKSGKIPIVIGGGHNNSFSNIKGTSLALQRPISVINIDPHADYRMEEGRHSGNGFRYAMNEKWLSHYGVWGLHENYNNQYILDSFSQNANLFYESLDNILRQKAQPLDALLSQFEDKIGCEIDLDSIKNMPTSAISPVGFSEEEVLGFIYQISKNKEVLYYHFAEGLSTDDNAYKIGKFLSYAVSSILKNDKSL